MNKLLLSVVFLVISMFSQAVSASAVYSYHGAYKDNYVDLRITTTFASWLTRKGGGSSKRIECLATFNENKVENLEVKYEGKTYKIKNYKTHEDKISLQSGKNLHLFDIELSYTIKATKTKITKKFTVFAGAFISKTGNNRLIFVGEKKPVTDIEKLHASQLAFKRLSFKNGQTYTYKVEGKSTKGYRTETTIKVNKGFVENRSFAELKQNKTAESISYRTLRTWTESYSDMNSHKEGAEAISMDKVYDKCAQLIRKKSRTDTVKLDFAPDDTLRQCRLFNRNRTQIHKNLSTKIISITFPKVSNSSL
ncbi:hypothetical protein KKF34_19460 [Myxococcota bacterium]|nr:hypothetical protein [Myxococcota bacterium]MBU1383110.1 hypothetical protein [Myxococcota bacterium]MBU1499067.1 hypothetical protein [Myxococcota bacterium]